MYDVEPGKQRKMSFKEYKREKIKMLSRDFKITLTPEELGRIGSLTTESAVNQFCLGVINKRWD